VVCGPRIIIVSVEVKRSEGAGENGCPENRQGAIEESASRIYEAERRLEEADQVERHDGQRIFLPKSNERVYHRLSVLVGGKRRVPPQLGDREDGFIHFLDESGLGAILGVIDTAADFLAFLDACESFIKGLDRVDRGDGGVEDLAALYIANGHSFPQEIHPSGPEGSPIPLEVTWRQFSRSPQYATLQNELKASYTWDRLIDSYADYLLKDGPLDIHKKGASKYQLALATMALQPRRTRAILAATFNELLENPARKAGARAARGFADTAFVFLIGKGYDREHRCRELSLRCLVIRGRVPGITTVVGIAIDRLGTSRLDHSCDISYLNIPEWNFEYEDRVAGIQTDLGYFNNIKCV
jgi:hypothetical protein